MGTLQADSKFKWLDKFVDNLLLAFSKSQGKMGFYKEDFNADKFPQRRDTERTGKK